MYLEVLALVAGVLGVLLILNLAIKLRESRLEPQASGSDFMFAQTTRSFGGADFIAAFIVVIVSLIGSGVAVLASLPSSRPADLPREPFAFRWNIVVPVTIVALALNWVTIRKRHAASLDWPSAGVAAAVILSLFYGLWYVLFA
jgi:uncharacterized membrane protein YozB (DUF420 family)